MLEGLTGRSMSGVQAGDQIVRINERVIETLKDARAALAEIHPGDPVRLVIRRGSGTDVRELKLNAHGRGGTYKPWTCDSSGCLADQEPRVDLQSKSTSGLLRSLLSARDWPRVTGKPGS